MKNLSIPAMLSSLALCATFALAQDITPTRVGPVSQYGQLMTGKNSQGKGQIYGSCEGVKDGAEVQVRGMSLYWSLMPQAMEFWSEEGISTMVNDMKIQIVRAAMATKATDDWNGEWNGIKLKGWEGDQTNQTKFMETVVEAAIKNDIYVIIDWHSHSAHQQTESAKTFFKTMAEKYGQYDNVIFEVFNEPENISWSDVKNYANQVIQVIRQYSDNLILVGNPKWDQNPSDAIGNEVTDSKNNTAYTLHYYANTHNWEGSYEWGESEGLKGEKAMNAGLSVFISEWGTGDANGGGTPNESRNKSWQDYANKHKLSWANWSASKIDEGTAAFQGSSTKTSLQYSTSGNLVKGYLSSNPTSYTKCGGDNGDENGGNNNGNNENSPIFAKTDLSYNVSVVRNTLHIAGGAATVEIFSLKGDKIMSIDQVSGTLSLASLPVGSYFARIQMGPSKMLRAIQIK